VTLPKRDVFQPSRRSEGGKAFFETVGCIIHHSTMKKITTNLTVLFLLTVSFIACSKNSEKGTLENRKTEWLLASFLTEKSKGIQINGNPQLVDSPYGQAVHFNGISDALFLEEMPFKSMEEFTVEMVFYPEINAPFEQRILHIGEVDEDRMLLEIRAVKNNWYFDGFVASKENKRALIDEQLTHPLGQWYHVALVVDRESMTTFVNGKQELSEPFSFALIESGRSSIGVRQNIRSWFKGKIYKIRITPKSLKPDDFMAY
jgi:hypothetical protein